VGRGDVRRLRRRSAAWATAVFGTAAVLLTGGLLIDVLRRR
jgi:hypothetical protein